MAEAQHGTRRRYQKGCHCIPCRASESEYQRGRRRNRNSPALASVADLPAEVEATEPVPPAAAAVGPESVQAAVLRELDLLDDAARDRPGQVATALAMARIMDSPLAIPQHPAAAGKLLEVLESLGRVGRKRKGKLAAVREMTAGA